MAITYQRVTFTPYVDDIFGIVRNRTAYISNHAISKEGVTQEKSLAMTEADRQWFDIFLRYAADAVYERLHAAGYIQTGGYLYNQTATDGRLYIQYKLYFDEEWDTTLIAGMNNAIEKYIVQYLLNEWFRECMYTPYLQIGYQQMEEANVQLKNLLNRRITPVRRPHTML